MVAKQQMKDNLSDTSENGAIKPNPGSPKSRLAMLKRSSAKLKTNASSNDPFRFQGNGVDFKGKFIGERDVTEARGDAMCAEAMRLAKAAVKAAGSHKQRIILNISIEGLKIKDEKSGAILYNFPVSKISFIARDTTDARAFGFIFGCADGKYKFYGIKTAQTADHAVLSIRDMFQVVFEMKKKQFEEAKQKKEEQENHENSQREESGCRMDGGVMVGDLLDLETELENIAQGFNQLQNIPSMPEDSWPSTATPNGVAFPVQTATDPFGNSFHAVPVSNGHIANGQPQFFQTPMQQNQSWAGFSTPQPHTNGLFNNGIVGNGLHSSPPFSGTNPFLQQPTFAMPQNGHSPFSSSMPPVSSQPFSLPPPQTMSSIPDPFDTQSAYRLINAMHSNGSSPPNGATSTAIPRPTPSVLNTHGLPSTHVNGVASAPNLDSIFGGASSLKENTAPSANTNNGFADFNSTNNVTKWDESKSRVTTLEEAFSKLVDMNALVSTTPETKKNPFEHLINPPKIPLNALASGAPTTTAPPPPAMIPPRPFPVHPPQQQFVMPTSKNDPFNDDFFN